MSRRPEQTFLQRHPDGRQPHEETRRPRPPGKRESKPGGGAV